MLVRTSTTPKSRKRNTKVDDTWIGMPKIDREEYQVCWTMFCQVVPWYGRIGEYLPSQKYSSASVAMMTMGRPTQRRVPSRMRRMPTRATNVSKSL